MKGFDSQCRQLIYAVHFIPHPSMNYGRKIYMGLDFDGRLHLFDKKVTNNPLLKLNMEAILSHSFKEIIRKVEII